MEILWIKALIERKANRGYSVVVSTATVDRQGDSIDQSGWDLTNFKKNPVMLWAHDYRILPIARANEISVVNNKLTIGDYEFAPAEGNPMSGQVKALVDGGFLNAVSVGFMPLERNGNVITKMELFEVSFVPVPANPEALQLMFSKGIAKEMISKFFEAKSEEIDVAEKLAQGGTSNNKKGAVADEVASEEALEAKYEKLSEVWEVMGAFCDVYLDEETDVEQFSMLLSEAIGLLQQVADSDGEDDDDDEEDDEDESITASLKDRLSKGVTKEAADRFIAKVGAAHSKNTKAAITKAIEHNNASTDVLKALITDEALTEDDDEKGVSVVPAESADDTKGVDVVRSLLVARSLLRESQHGSQSALEAVNGLLKTKRQAEVVA